MKEPVEPTLQLPLPGSSPLKKGQVVHLSSAARQPLPANHRGNRGRNGSLEPNDSPEPNNSPEPSNSLERNNSPEPSNNSRQADGPGQASNRKPGKKPDGLWYALYLPGFSRLPEAVCRQRLELLAQLATEVSSGVSFHPCALVLEIRSSLRYFAGIDNLHETLSARILQQLQEWQLPTLFHYAASPTVSGSLLLARGGCNLLVYRRSNLRSALGRLSTDVLDLEREQRRRLHNMGVRRLQDLWRLPAEGLRKRFGSRFVNQLHQALGERPEPQQHYQPPPAFNSSYDLPCEVENTGLLLPVLEEFLAQLVDFLRRRDLSTSRLVISLVHEQQRNTDITLGLRQPSRCRHHLQQLVEIQLHNLVIPAPVVAVRMQVTRFDAYLGTSGKLLAEDDRAVTANATNAGEPDNRTADRHGHYRDDRLDLFLDQLLARIGGQNIRRIGNVAEHCPEYATRQLDSLQAPDRGSQHACPSNPRPLWLLPEPRLLQISNGKLYHHRPVSILSGPERIESRWWSGTDIRRDYYVAREDSGSRLWIFREKTGGRHWYLHGIFA